MVIAFAAIGAAIIEQQLNMAAAEAKGATNSDAIAAFLAEVTVYLSLIGFVIQVGLTSRIHRVLGIGFALLVLPMSLGTTAIVMLMNRRAVGAGPRARDRHVAALHGGQDLARGAVPPAAGGIEVPRQAVHRRHGRSRREGPGRAADPGADQALGPGAHVAAAELREPHGDGAVGVRGDARAQGIHADVPPQHRAAGRVGDRRHAGGDRTRRRSRRW